MSQTCVYCSRPKSSRASGRNNALTSSLHAIKRYALNGKGVVGSLYDARTENLLSALPANKDLILRKDIKETPACKLLKVNASNRDNLLQMIGIEDDLRVSIALNMTQINEGTLMLHTYKLPTDRTVRLIDYYHVNQEKCLSDDIQTARNTLPYSLPNSDATHIITSVKRGFDFVIVLELPENANPDEIDFILDKLCECFIKPEVGFLSTEEQQKINDLKLTIFTQITDINSIAKRKNLSDISRHIRQLIGQNRQKWPLSYTLYPVKCIYHGDPCVDRIFCQSDQSIIQKIEQQILPVFRKLKAIQHLFYDEISPQLSQCLQIRVKKIRENISGAEDMYTGIQLSLAEIITEFRRGKPNLSLLDDQLKDAQIKTLELEIENIQTALLKFRKKASFMIKLEADHQMEYLNVVDLEGSNDDEKTLETKLIRHSQKYGTYYLCSSDDLLENGTHEYDKLCQQLIELRRTNLSLRLVFADFSYCSHKLKSMKILQPLPARLQRVQSVIKPTEINVLLVGETGVGKSTFINAFVNYLAFHSLGEAASGQPIVLIPVSFIITSGDHFEEKKIEFGQFDSNENHNQSGQSVTQHCKSYIFTIDNNVKLRIIDTPGIGDTRGAKQDNENIQHILSYTSNLPHLNAICFLLKPNTTRLHGLFRSCFTQLFNFLGPNARDNIIFCFTNTRATFYAPGETGKLLQEMLNRLPNDSRPSFAKRNTFCFDSESFRYLAIIKSGHNAKFLEDQKLEFENSWKMSVTESIRLLDFVKLRPQYEMNAWHSIEHVQMTITLLVRPILETIRNALRNLILWDTGNKQRMIELKAQPISLPAWLCTACFYKTTQMDNSSTMVRAVHNDRTTNECTTCRCGSDKHLPIFYELKYQLSGTKGTKFQSDTENMKGRLLHASLIMTQFLLSTNDICENPFLPWFDLLIQEEQQLSHTKKRNDFHDRLYDNVRKMKKEYETDINENRSDQDQITLDAIYGCVEEVLAYPMISEQMNAIKASQMEMMKNDEHDVSSQYPRIAMTELLRHSTATTNN